MKRLLLLCLLTAVPVAAQESVVIPMERTPVGWLVNIWVCEPSRPDGGGFCKEQKLLLDTGANDTALDATYLGLRRSEKMLTVHLGSGSEQRAVIPQLSLLLHRPTGKPTKWGAKADPLDVDFRRLRESCQCDVAGLIGANFLEQFASVTLDFQSRTTTLTRTLTRR